MRALVVAVALVGVFALFPYVRREWQPRGQVACLVVGSRDRQLAGQRNTLDVVLPAAEELAQSIVREVGR